MNVSRSLGYMLHHVSSVLDRQSDLLLQEKFNIGFSQFKIMMALQAHEGIRQREIAGFLGQTEASVSRQVRLLIESGLVTSRIEPSNRRQRVTCLTAAGEELGQKAINALVQYHAPMFNKLSPDQQADLQSILEIMHEHTCAFDKHGSCIKKKG